MNLSQPATVIALSAIGVAFIGFNVGRRVEIHHQANAPQRASHSESDRVEPKPKPLEDVNLEEIGTIPFYDLYNELRVASPEQRHALRREIDAMPDSPARGAAMFTFYKLLVQIDPAAAAAEVEDLKNDTETLRVVINAAPQSAMGEMAKMLLKLPEETWNTHFRGDYLSQILNKWSRVDPEAASRFVLENCKGVNFSGYVADVVENWAALDPLAARRWLERQDQSDLMRSDTNYALLHGWFQNNPREAAQFAIAHASDETIADSASRLGGEIYLRSPDAAKAFVDAMPTDKAKKGALDSVIGTVRAFDPRAPATDVRPTEGVANWLLQFPPNVWSDAMSTLVTRWKIDDADGLFAWLNGLSPDVQQRVVEGYRIWLDWPSEMAGEIQTTMKAPNPQLREKLLRQLAKHLGSSPQEAIDTLEQTKLTPDEKAYMAKLVRSQ